MMYVCRVVVDATVEESQITFSRKVWVKYVILFYFDETLIVAKTSCLQNVALIQDETKQIMVGCKVSSRGCSGELQVTVEWRQGWRTTLVLLASEAFDEFWRKDPAFFIIFGSCFQQGNVKFLVFYKVDDISKVWCESWFLDDFEGNCEVSDQCMGSTRLTCKYG